MYFSSVPLLLKLTNSHHQIDSLDIYLPLLIHTSQQISTSIAQLLGSAIRSPAHRKAISEWLPPAERAKEVKTRRGWEKTSAIGREGLNAPTRGGGWVARNLTGLLKSRDVKVRSSGCG